MKDGVYYNERDRFCFDGQWPIAIAGPDGAESRTENTSTNFGTKA